MFELILVACVSAKICQYVTAPIVYPTVSRCHIAAALLAGQVRGTREPGATMEYSHECRRKVSIAELTSAGAADAPAIPPD